MNEEEMVYFHAVVFLLFIYTVSGHGYLRDPPQRSSLWRIYPHHFPPNYNDNALNCGGREHQWKINKGQCGPCGDPFDDVRLHEEGGMYHSGFVSRNYTAGSVVTFTVRITSNHRGWFEFRLCSVDKPYQTLDSCLEETILEIDDGSKFYEVGDATGDIKVRVKLPQRLSCSRCVLQWKYNTGNSWGCNNNDCCIGCGQQEQFYNCADIGIHNTNEGLDFNEMDMHEFKRPSPTPTQQRIQVCEPTPIFQNVPGMKTWCQNTCPFCPRSHCKCDFI